MGYNSYRGLLVLFIKTDAVVARDVYEVYDYCYDTMPGDMFSSSCNTLFNSLMS